MKLWINGCFLCLLACISWEDIKSREISDGRQMQLGILGLLMTFLAKDCPVTERAAGLFCVSVPMLMICLLYPGAFGGGDIKLSAAGGFYLGWKKMAVAGGLSVLLAGAYIIGFVIRVVLKEKRISMKMEVAYGPFLCIGMAAALFWGEALIQWYGK